MGILSGVVILQGAGTVGSVRFFCNNGLLRLDVLANLPPAYAGEYYLFVMNRDCKAEHYRLGEDGNIKKRIEQRSDLVADDKLICAICRVGKGIYHSELTGGMQGKTAYLQVIERYFKDQEFYKPQSEILKKIERVDIARAESTPDPVKPAALAEERKAESEVVSAKTEEKHSPEEAAIAALPAFAEKVESETYSEERLISPETARKIENIESVLDLSSVKGYFYERIREPLGQIFSKYESEQSLEELIDDSRWARVIYGDRGEYYTVGVVYENNLPAFIGYGVPGKSETRPPKELEGFCEWLPTTGEGGGYWMMYQNAKTGENIRVLH